MDALSLSIRLRRSRKKRRSVGQVLHLGKNLLNATLSSSWSRRREVEGT